MSYKIPTKGDCPLPHEIAKECHRIAQANGFDHPTWDSLISKAMLVVTELDEARDGTYGSGKDPLAEELADVAIRLLHLIHGIWGDSWATPPGLNNLILHMFHGNDMAKAASRTHPPIEIELWRVVSHVCKGVEAWRKNDEDETRTRMKYALYSTFRVAKSHGIDLMEEIRAKCEKNSKRGYLHGKASSV